MSYPDLINLITQKYPKLTKAERKVAEVVLAEPQKVLEATITDLAAMCGVGETSVFRFCRTLNLQGYQEFKLSLALSTSHPQVLDSNDILVGNHQSDDMDVLLKNIHNTYLLALSDTIAALDTRGINKAVDILVDATSIHLFGMGSSGVTAMEAQDKLVNINPRVCYHQDSHTQLTTAALLGKGSAAVIFSNSGTTKDCIALARMLRENGANVILVTKFPSAPMAKYADVVLVGGAAEGPAQGGSIAVKISQLFVVDVLYTEYFRRLGEDAVQNKYRTAASVADKML